MPEASCPTGKVQYRDRVAALLTLASMPGSRDEQRAYRCPDCQRWHLTSKRTYAAPRIAPRHSATRKPYVPPGLRSHGPAGRHRPDGKA